MVTPQPELSVVIPVFNESDNIEALYREMSEALDPTGIAYEVIAVDDGSRDGSFEKLRAIHERDPRWRVVRLARNFGQNPALYAGFSHVRGRKVVTIDADLQNPPADIPKLLAKLDEGYDVAQGWRESRKDNLFRRLASLGVNTVVRKLTKVDVHDIGCGVKAYRREIIERLAACTHQSRYVPAETAWVGALVGEVPVSHRDRSGGESKYGLYQLLRVNFDMIASISAAPVHLIGLGGALFSVIGFGMAGWILYLRLTMGNYSELATVTALLFFLAGVQMICLSVLCEYVSRIYMDVQQRPYYLIGEVLGNDREQEQSK